MKFLGVFICLCLMAGIVSISVSAGDRDRIVVGSFATPTPSPTPVAGETAPAFSSYRGISIRMPAAQVAEKLGQPTQRSKRGDYFSISANESVQISYDTDQTVKSISINFTGDLKNAPTAKTVVGSDVKKDADGLINKMVSYPKNGFWVSYIRTPGNDATVVITFQKIPIE